MAATIANMQQMYDLMGRLNAVTRDMVGNTHLTYGRQDLPTTSPISTTSSGRSVTSLLLGATLFRHPVCFAIRSVFDTLDNIDATSDDIQALLPSLDQLDALTAQLRTH